MDCSTLFVRTLLTPYTHVAAAPGTVTLLSQPSSAQVMFGIQSQTRGYKFTYTQAIPGTQYLRPVSHLQLQGTFGPLPHL